MKLESLTVAILFLVLSVSFALNIYQHNRGIKLMGDLGMANKNWESLDLKINNYLEAEGRKCDIDIDTGSCLDSFILRLESTTGKDCSSVSDDACPKWCAVGSDYDCCIEKGYQWVNGRGCYQ